VEMSWNAESRVATVRFGSEATLTGAEATTMVSSLAGWIGKDAEPFGLVADVRGVGATNAEYRSITRVFFAQHRETALVAAFNASAAIRIVAELFRVATGIQLKAFTSEVEARRWLCTRGIAA
jgi:hypothetical protein